MKKIMAVLLSFMLMLSCSSAWAHPFTDVAGHWAEAEIEKAYAAGVVSGDGDGSFRPGDTVSRAEFLKMVTALLAEKFEADIPILPESEHWAEPYYTFSAWNYLPPMPEITYDGVAPGVMSKADFDLPIRRWEMAYILDSAFLYVFGLQETEQIAPLNDMETIIADYESTISTSINSVAAIGLARGDENGNFNAGSTGTRAEAVTLINRSGDVMDALLKSQEPEESRVTYEEIPEGHPVAQFTMADGKTFEVTLYPEYAPQTCANFVALVESGFYDGLTFHRVVDDFMAQGGDPKGDGTGGAEGSIVGEFAANGHTQNTLSHTRGVVSMARSSHPDSASSQFFICYGDASFLDGQYAAFGEVTSGMEAVESFLEAERTENSMGELAVPVTPIVIEKAVMKK